MNIHSQPDHLPEVLSHLPGKQGPNQVGRINGAALSKGSRRSNNSLEPSAPLPRPIGHTLMEHVSSEWLRGMLGPREAPVKFQGRSVLTTSEFDWKLVKTSAEGALMLPMRSKVWVELYSPNPRSAVSIVSL